jgi:hypothetical protein
LTFAAEKLARCNAYGALIFKVLKPLNLKKDSGLLTGLLTQSPQILNLMQGILPLSFIDTRTACALAAKKYIAILNDFLYLEQS